MFFLFSIRDTFIVIYNNEEKTKKEKQKEHQKKRRNEKKRNKNQEEKKGRIDKRNLQTEHEMNSLKMKSNRNTFWNTIWEGLSQSLKSVGTLLNIFGEEQKVQCQIIRDRVYDTALPTLRYMFESDPPKYHVPYNTLESMDWAVLGLRFMFTDMKYPRSKYDSDEEYDNAIDAIRTMFAEETEKQMGEKQRIQEEEQKTRIKKTQPTKVFDDSIILRNKPLPKASTHFVRRPVSHKAQVRPQ